VVNHPYSSSEFARRRDLGALQFQNARRMWISLCRLGTVGLTFIAFGCGKSVIPRIDDLVSRSSLIYLAEKRGGEYQIVTILKATPEAPIKLSVGQPVVPNYQILGHKPATQPHRIVIFVQSVTMIPGKQLNAGQTEVPLLESGELVSFRITVPQLLQMIRDEK